MPAIDQRTEIAFERILLATDFSPTADIATAYAVGLARRFSSTLELTNVIDLSATAPSVDVLIGARCPSTDRRGTPAAGGGWDLRSEGHEEDH